MRSLYLLLLIPIIHTIIFHYVPMYGVLLAFKDFKAADGIIGSQWNHFEHFKFLFTSPGFSRVFKNTLYISVLKILFGFPAPIILALLINEIHHKRFKKTVQTISYLPHFMSWVVLAGIMTEMLSPQRGPINYLRLLMGRKPIPYLTDPKRFVSILIISGVWKGVGWGSIIYLATLTSVDPGLYEAAEIDGATRFHKAIHISLPALTPVMTILFILGLGSILNAGFDQIFNLYNPLVIDVADIIDTYVYRIGLQQMQYDYATAVGLFKNIIGLILIFGTNAFLRKFTDYGVW